MPRVTVVVPNYNHQRFLDQRIQSVLSQSFRDFEVLLLDDASTDESVAVLQKYLGDSRVRPIVRNTVNTGVPFTQWNRGVAAAQGEYVWIAESDDYADPRLLETLVGMLDAHPRVGVAYSQSLAVDDNGNTLYSLIDWTNDLDPGRWTHDYSGSGPDECRRFLAVKATIPNASAVVFRRSVYVSTGGADESFRLAGDHMLWAKLLLESDVAFCATPLNFFRVHGNTVRSKSRRTALALDEAIRIFDYIRARVDIPREVQDLAIGRMISRWSSECGEGSLGSIARHVQVYRAMRRIDPRLHRRLLSRAATAARSRLSAK
jgi:glycosyltransferase involved in cell wall biosynthesis